MDRNPDVQISFIVTHYNVKRRPKTLYLFILQYQRFQLGLDRNGVDFVNPLDQGQRLGRLVAFYKIRSQSLAQVLGLEYFTLLEVVPKEGVALKAGDKIYVGKEERDKVSYIKRRISYNELTNNSIAEIDKALEKVIKENEAKFVDFFNISRPITIKRHQLELLPGLGKKHMLEIVRQRELQKFESFQDLEKRIHLMPNPVHIVAKRIIEELEGKEDKHFLFVRPPSKKPFDFSERNF